MASTACPIPPGHRRRTRTAAAFAEARRRPAREGVPAGVETGIRLKTGDATTIHADLEARGVNVGELLCWPGVPPMFAVHDQDGNGLEIVEAA